jgi:hypothetical protein
MGPTDPTEGSGIGPPILSVVGATDDDTRTQTLRAEAAEFNVPATKLMAIRLGAFNSLSDCGCDGAVTNQTPKNLCL